MAAGAGLGLVADTDVPVEHLDYDYIGKCSNPKELAKLLTILRSNRVGAYPHLERYAEERLFKMDPGHQLLVKEGRKKTLRDLPTEEQQELENDLESWSQVIHTEDCTLTDNTATIHCNGEQDSAIDGERKREREREIIKNLGLPPIRKQGQIGQNTKTFSNKSAPSEGSKNVSSSSQRIKSNDFQMWDRFDADMEVAQVDTEEEKREDKGGGGGRKVRRRPTVRDTLTESEKDMTAIERGKLAIHEKEKGNESFKSGDFEEALAYYSRSIHLKPSIPAYNNRALMYIKLKKPSEAVGDCLKVLEEDPDNQKALFRLATARTSLGQETDAIADFERLLQLDPSNKKAHDQLRSLRAKHGLKGSAGEQLLKKNRLHIVEVEGCGGEEGVKLMDEGEDEEGREEGEDWEGENRERRQRMQELLEALERQRRNRESKNAEKDVAGKKGKSKSAKMDEKAGKGGRKENNGVSGATRLDGKQAANRFETRPQKPVNPAQQQQPTTTITTETPPTSIIATPTTLQAPPPLPPALQQLKEDGNKLFRSGQYGEAALKYSIAINQLRKEGDDSPHTLSLTTFLNNRAACYLKTGECNRCIEDCTQSISFQPHNHKALLRRGSAYELKEKYQEAYMDYHLTLRLDSTIQLAQQATTRLARYLQDIYGHNWRVKLPSQTDAQIVLDAITAQRTLTPADTTGTHLTQSDADQTQESSGSTSQTTPVIQNDDSQTPLTSNIDSQTPLTQEHDIDGVQTQSDSTVTPETQADAISTSIDKTDDLIQHEVTPEETHDDTLLTPLTSTDTTVTQPTSSNTMQTPVDSTVVTPDDTGNSEKLYDEYKSKGNRHVKKDEYTEAVKWYSECIELYPRRAAAFNNRAFCYLKMKNPEGAEGDCSHALELEPDNIKALYRRGVARKELGKYKEAMKDLRTLVNLDASNAAGNKELETVKQLWEKQLRTLQSKPNRSIPKETKPDQKSGTRKSSASPFSAARGPTSTRGQVNTGGQATTKISPTSRAKNSSKGSSGNKSRGSSKKSSSNEAGGVAREAGVSGNTRGRNSAERVVPQTNTRKSAVECLLKVGEEEEERAMEGEGEGEGRLLHNLINADKTTYFKKFAENNNHQERTKIDIVEVEQSSDEENQDGEMVSGVRGSGMEKTPAGPVGEGKEECGEKTAEKIESREEREGREVVGDTVTGDSVEKMASERKGELDEEDKKMDAETSEITEMTPEKDDREKEKKDDIVSDEVEMRDAASNDVRSNETNKQIETKMKVKPNKGEQDITRDDEDTADITNSPSVLRLTSYEFVQRWNSIPRSARSEDFAKLLKLIPLHQLPDIITNKLDGTMLTRILEAVNDYFIPRGMYKLTVDLLYNLSRVQRFSMVAMFLSRSEKQGLSKILDILSSQNTTQISPDVLQTIKTNYAV